MHDKNGSVVDLFNTSSMVWGGTFGEEGDCFNFECITPYNIELQEHYFYVANWDTNLNRTVKFSLIENFSHMLKYS